MKEYHESNYGVNNILVKSCRESTKTTDNTSPAVMLKTIKYIEQAKRVFILARGLIALIAEEFQVYLQLLGYDAIIVKDVKWMENIERTVTKGDTTFILSLQNSVSELARSARVARMKGAKVVTRCCKSPCELEKFSDIIIHGHFGQIMEVGGMMVHSRIPLLIITRAIVEYIGQ